MDRQTAMTRVAAQPPQIEKVATADVVIDTEGTMDDTVRLFDIAWQRLLRTVPAPIAVQQRKRSSERVRDPRTRPLGLDDSDSADLAYYSKSGAAFQAPESGHASPESAEVPMSEATGANGVTVRRARPSDVPAILWLIRRTSTGAVRTKREELLLSLGERGYLIGENKDEIRALAGWSSENLVATIDLIIVNPPEEAFLTGAAVLQEIENTANSLICEVILAFPPADVARQVRQLFMSRGFVKVQPLQSWIT
jgi:N-acetylglutamate synthase-like GNAT family acetyltransferase